MKERSLFYLIVTLAVLTAGVLPVFAQSQRYPTLTEMQRLRQQFRQRIRSIQNDPQMFDYIRDRRNQQELQNRQSFVRSWSIANSVLAPFLGSWSGYEESIRIYPSNVKDRVCIVVTGEGFGSFTIGSLSNSQILTNDGKVIFKEGNYLGIASIDNNNKPIINLDLPLNSPRPLETITQLSGINEAREKRTIIQQFNTAGCTASRPARR